MSYASLYSENNINYLIFKSKAEYLSYEYDYSELDKLLIKPYVMNCLFCGKPSMTIKKDKDIYICFSCNKKGRLSDLDIVKKTKKEEKFKYYDEIYNELKEYDRLKTKEYALFGITYYKLDSTFIDPELYEDEDIMFELIRNHAFDTSDDTYTGLKIFSDKNFQKRILDLDKNNIYYIENNNIFETYDDSERKEFENDLDDDLLF